MALQEIGDRDKLGVNADTAELFESSPMSKSPVFAHNSNTTESAFFIL